MDAMNNKQEHRAMKKWLSRGLEGVHYDIFTLCTIVYYITTGFMKKQYYFPQLVANEALISRNKWQVSAQDEPEKYLL